MKNPTSPVTKRLLEHISIEYALKKREDITIELTAKRIEAETVYKEITGDSIEANQKEVEVFVNHVKFKILIKNGKTM